MKSKGLRHGTLTGYQYYGCKCDECKAANAARARKLRTRWRRKLAQERKAAK